MQERLKEIVIYILENGTELAPEQRAELERVWDELNLGSFPVEQIEAALSRALEIGLQESDAGFFDILPDRFESFGADDRAMLYLVRLEGSGLIDAEQRSEILLRANRLQPEGPGLDEVQFAAASIIFDERLGRAMGWAGTVGNLTASIH